MNLRYSVLLAIPLVAAAATAPAATHRLAYSKAENVEVFVDHPDDQPWCSDDLKLRFVFSEAVDQAAIDRLLPKLGGLMSSQCPAATQLSWTAADQSGAGPVSGTASQATGWAARPAQAATTEAVAGASAPVTESAPPAPASEASAPTQKPSTTPGAPELDAAAKSLPQAEPVPAPAATAPKPASQPAQPPVAQVVPQPAPIQAAPEPSAVPAVSTKPFSVAGWQPASPQEVFAKADFLTEVSDQNGCRFRLAFTPQDGIANVTARSKGVTCGSDGYAEGEGTLELVRRDGVQVHDFTGSFLNGLEVRGDVPRLPVVGLDKDRHLYLLLHSEPASQVHYLIRLDYFNYGNHWNSGGRSLIALTENRDLFRDLNSIQLTLDLATAYLTERAPSIRGIRFYGVRDLVKGMQERDRDYWLYEIALNQHYRTKKWEYEPAGARNHLFAFERKEAERQRQAELERERKAQLERELAGRQAEQQMQLYHQLRDEARDPEALYQRLLTDASYTPFGGGGYASMMRGNEQPYNQIVHIDSEAGSDWAIDYPYAAVLEAGPNQPAVEEGWYLVKGQARLDRSEKDEQGLPLTRVTAASIQACNEDGCADLLDPLTLVRHQIGDPQWTPELARQRIAQAWPERAAQQGDAK
ncbi:hypothetical protein [Stutzerimonas urumqiensis]|uniref:hypothetical protein n=1 Tax=Stutzerimonas urumqiensis TaxID=638269 RepID=UPI0013CF071C|nr:hypothetical protein [Stutzerimonas urumqiensis]